MLFANKAMCEFSTPSVLFNFRTSFNYDTIIPWQLDPESGKEAQSIQTLS